MDPAPASREADPVLLRRLLMDPELPLFERFQSIFALRDRHDDPAARVLGEAMVVDRGALLRHECAYVLGQMQRPAAIPFLLQALRGDPSPMVRHEAAEALGAIGTDEVVPHLEHYLMADPAPEVRESCELALQHIRYLKNPRRL